MSLISKLRHLVHPKPCTHAPRTAAARPHRAVRSDSFEIVRRARVDLGKAAPASAAADAEYVKSLYRDLLGRGPDPEGFRAHLSGLQTGMSREQLRQVFLGSAEFRQKAAPPPVAKPEPVSPARLGGEAQLRQLIAADIKTASGREATDADYSYWLPKLQSECDSGFVTSGQMTGVEYYHRRMLGWQAGGADVATSGPYAGSGEAHGPVPSATDVVGPITASTGPAPTSGSTAQLRRLIAADIKIASGREATDADYSYWLPKLQSDCDSGFVTSGQMTGVEYYHRRMLGWQAGGADVATAGPYAGSGEAHGPVPSATDVVGPLGG